MEHLVNPVKLIRKPKLPPGRDRRLAPGEEPKLLLACHPALLPIVKLAIETAMRRSELVGLQWQDVNLGKRIAHLRDTKNGTARSVPLSAVAVGVLCSQAAPQSPPSGTLKVWSGVDEVWVTRAFTAAARRAGCVGLRFHDLRHEATSRYAPAG
jgi:integrase